MKNLINLLLIVFTLNTYAQHAGYSFGKQIIIDASQVSGAAPLTNFPVLISVTDTDLRTTSNGGSVENTSGFDIIFTLEDCATILSHDLEYYNPVTGELVIWLQVPLLDNSANTPFFMFYGNSSVATNQSTTDIWTDANYETVLHVHDNFTDATGNGVNGTNNGSTNIIGKIADGQNFVSASTQYIDLGNTASLNFAISDWTLSAWIKTTQTSKGSIISNGGDNGGGVRYVMATNETVGNKLTLTTDDNSTKRQSTSTTSVNDNIWHYVVSARDGTTIRIYVDGVAEGINTLPGGYNLSSSSQKNTYIGTGISQASGLFIKPFNGDIDEARISNIFRSAEWISTEFNNQNSPSTFYSISTEMNAVSLCSVLPIILLNCLVTVKDKIVQLDWQTASEINNDYFTIERSKNGLDWQELTRVNGAGNSSALLSYSTTDNKPYLGISYYRLKQTDFDGQFENSFVRSVQIEKSLNSSVEIYPNPTNNKFTIIANASELEQIKIFNSLGHDVTKFVTKTGDNDQSSMVFDMSELNTGMYYVRTKTTANKVYKQ
tara:strand:- start:1170 stop:2813 length:1644 start_codon:yes stop_codon:yes gene_type:complete